MRAEPVGERRLADAPIGDAFDRRRDVTLGGLEILAVQAKENTVAPRVRREVENKLRTRRKNPRATSTDYAADALLLPPCGDTGHGGGQLGLARTPG